MTRPRLKAIGTCARMTEVGDRAFRFARDLARSHGVPLDIFVFPTSPCEEHERRGRQGERFELEEKDAVDIERRVRLYYDDLLEDQDLDVGFRLCLGDEAPELRSCLFQRQFDILVLAYEKRLCPFGERTIEEFARRMQCPVVLIGPGRRDEIHLNDPARLRVDDLGLGDGEWQSIEAPEETIAVTVARRLTEGEVHALPPDEFEELLQDAVTLRESDTRLFGPIRVLDLGGAIAVQERSRDGAILVRGLPSVEEANRFVDDRLEAYGRIWDECADRIDYGV